MIRIHLPPMQRSLLYSLLFLASTTAADQSNPDPDCQCRDSTGAMKDLGSVVCVNITGRKYLVRCEMSQNTPYWKRLRDESGCPSAKSRSPLQVILASGGQTVDWNK